ncbi:MAG: hypothetical protein Q7S34_01700 [bacterium]|nr:hypothetical protein [bacterium]
MSFLNTSRSAPILEQTTCLYCKEPTGYSIGRKTSNGTCGSVEKAANCPSILNAHCGCGESYEHDYGRHTIARRINVLGIESFLLQNGWGDPTLALPDGFDHLGLSPFEESVGKLCQKDINLAVESFMLQNGLGDPTLALPDGFDHFGLPPCSFKKMKSKSWQTRDIFTD